VFGVRPFHFFSDIDALVAQMIHFGEELPVEWTAEWEQLQKKSEYNYNLDDHIPSTSLSFRIGLTNV
jgi:hypothetical protein